MSDDNDDASEELGKTGEKMGGIADRFGATTEATETAETTDTTETAETTETIETTEGNVTQSADMTETTEATATTETGETIETPETTDTLVPGDEGFVLREDWNGRTIYLPDDVVDDLDIRYSEVNVEWQREHGEQLPKNERFYPALVRAAINETSLEEELGLSD
ncbi:HNH endonuclease [Halorubrum sp. CGM4_25_10-8A]|uniref:HNH endonuclease n=1 Tax=Halorubrum sp. CGM4_25_10-8A TaxID=2518116 RepID=UPI0010F5A598|nr:HNH endonuclease [Halorubrum sp. CGM4_25_10-8A]TKX36631.1 HNH endonuclease [Halorubrum sp. CGM4_25_10-8A]